MYKRILLPTDGSDITEKATQTAVALAKLCGATIYAVSIKEPFPYSTLSEMQPVPPQQFMDHQEHIARTRVKAVEKAAGEAGVPCQMHTVEATNPWRAIVDHGEKQGCDLIVMASHGRRGVSALLIGSETQKVLTHTQMPVLVVR